MTSKRLDSELVNSTVQSTANTAVDFPRQASVSPSTQAISHETSKGPSLELTSLPPAEIQIAEENKVDPEQLLHDLVRLGLVQTDGIIDMFVSHKISTLVRSVFNGFRRQQVDDRISKDLTYKVMTIY